MNNFKNQIKQNFTATPNTIINDNRLSWKAKGIFLYLASKPNDWNFYMDEIKENATDGKESLQSGIKELEEFGYLARKAANSEDGTFDGWNWVLKMPTNKDLTVKGVNHQTGKPPSGSTTGRETPTTNTNTNNTNKDNTKKDTQSAPARENEQSLIQRAVNANDISTLSDVWEEWKIEVKKPVKPTIHEKQAWEFQMKQWGLKKTREIMKVALREGYHSLKEDYLSKDADEETESLGDNSIFRS